MADQWGTRKIVQEKTAAKARKSTRGDIDGRVVRSTPVPMIPQQKRPIDATMEIYVQPDEPDTTTIGALWFDTDEPVPS